MAGLSSSDFDAALTFVRDCDSARDVDDFARRVLTIRKLVPCKIVGYNSVDLTAGRVTAVIDPIDAVPAEAYPSFERFMHQHPVIAHHERTGDWSPSAISDFLTAQRFHRTDLYRQFYGPLGIEDQIAMLLPPSTRVIGIALNRASRGFSRRERLLLDILRRHIAGSHATVQARTRAHRLLATMGEALEDTGRSLAMVRPDGRVAWCTSRVPELLRSYFGRPRPPAALPDDVAMWLGARRRAERQRTLADPGEPLVSRRGAVRLAIEHIPRSEAEDDDMLLFVEDRDPLARERLVGMGLTRRQAEVASLLGRGRSNAEIASELGLSVRTVEKHLEGAYRGLGVGGRTQALSRLLGDST